MKYFWKGKTLLHINPSEALCAIFGDEIGQLFFKEAELNLVKSMFIWRFDLPLETQFCQFYLSTFSAEILEDFLLLCF